MALTGDQVKSAVLTAVGSPASTAAELAMFADCTMRKVFTYTYNDNATAATDSNEQMLWVNNTGVDWKVTRVDVVTTAAATANDTNNKIWTVGVRRVATPGTSTAICAPTTATTGVAAGLGTTVAFKSVTAPNPGAYTVANNVVQPGDVLYCITTHGGSGVVTTGATAAMSGTVTVQLEPVL